MKKRIYELIKEATNTAVDFELETSSDSRFGDYTTNLALRLGKEEKRSPLETASDLIQKISAFDRGNLFEKIEAAAPGFINFSLSKNFLLSQLKEILRKKKKYGRSLIGKKQKVQMEFISANPSGPLTLASGRGGFFGDILSNILEFSNYKVEREYYVNDTGNQIIILGKSILAELGLIKEEDNFYKGDYVKDWAESHKESAKRLKDDPLKLGQAAAREFLKNIRTVIEKKAGIHFDRWTSEERHIHKKGFVEKAFALLKKSGLVYKQDGALWLKTKKFGDDKDRVLVTSDNFPTYFLADAGHYLETKTRGLGKKINILGPDHYGYVKRIQAAAQIIGIRDSEIIITQAIRLVSGGKEVKMSKRAGQFVTFEELIDEVGADAARFFFLMHAPETHMDFDLDLAREASPKNPVYYVQYAYVRAKNIIKKAKSLKRAKKISLELLGKPTELNLIKELIKLPDIVEDTTKDLRVHRLTKYALGAAKAFHNFYEKERVIGEERSLSRARLMLIKAVEIVFSNLSDLLGIQKLDKM